MSVKPVVACLHVNRQRDGEVDRVFHDTLEDCFDFFHAVTVTLDDQLVVYLQNQPCVQTGCGQFFSRLTIAALMMSAAVPWMGLFMATRSPNAISIFFDAVSSGI